jgi:GT2 family glycosyltransferase
MTITSHNPLISVIIVSWNARSYLEQCLTSLTSEMWRYPLEIIVVDNASTDGSPESVENRFPNVRLVRNTSNLGFSKANNQGIAQSTGKYICFVNSDVKVLDGCITKLVDYMQAHPNVGMAGPSMLGPDGRVGRSCRGFPTVWNMLCHALGLDFIFPKVRLFGGYALRFWPHDTTRRVDILGGWFWIVRREALDEVGLLDEEFFFYAEDMDWCKRFHLNGLRVDYVAEAVSIHFGGGSSKRAPLKYHIQRQRADLHYWKKHHSKLGQAAYFCICLVYQTTRLLGNGVLLPFFPRSGDRAHAVELSWRSLLWLLKGAK